VPASAERERTSGAAPRSHEVSVRRGRVRDALATLANVESVLRSGKRVPAADELEELRVGLVGLREAFAAAVQEAEGAQREARASLEAFAADRVGSVETATGDPSAPALPDLLAGMSRDLDAAAGLLELAERATEPAPVEVSVTSLAEQTLQLAWAIRSQGAVAVHLRASASDCLVSCDPHVMARMVAIAVAAVREITPAVVVRTHVEDDAGVVEVTGFTSADLGAVVKQTRIAARIEPTEAVLIAAAGSAGLGLSVERGRVTVRCRRIA
jgi:hypothetical protein